MLLSELLSPERIRIPLRGGSKDELLAELVGVLHEAGAIDDREGVLRAVQEREALLSTGVGSGVAIPHAKAVGAHQLTMAAGVTAEGVDFDALDGRPVNLFFLLVGSDEMAGQHLKALSRISRLVPR